MTNHTDRGDMLETKGVLQLFVHGKLRSEHPIGSTPIIIGRSPECDIVIPDSSISKRHAKVEFGKNLLTVKDLGSAHGVEVDGQSIKKADIKSNKQFSILEYQFRYLNPADYGSKKGTIGGHLSQPGDDYSGVRPTTGAAARPSATGYYGYGGAGEYASFFDGSTFLAEVLGIVRERWRLIGAFIVVALVVGGIHTFLAVPTYQTNALVQVEPRSRDIGGPFSDFENSRRINDALVDEVEVLQSRSVLGAVVDELGLSIKASPAHAPFVGSAIARSRAEDGPAKEPLFGLNSYSWSNERIVVASMDIPDRYVRNRFQVIAGSNGTFSVHDSDGSTLARGKVGEPLTNWLPGDEPSSLFVSELNANSGAVFSLRKIPRLEAISQLRNTLGIADGGGESSILRLTFTGTSPERIADILNNIVSTYVVRNVEQQSEDALRTLQFVEQQIPMAKAKMEDAESRLSELRLQRGSVDLPRDTQVVLDKIVRLEFQVSELQRDRAELIERFTPQHPRVRSIDAQIAEMQMSLASTETEVKELPTTEREVLSVSRDVAVASELYISLVNRAQELQVVSAYAATTGNVRVVDYASVPLFPFRPNRALLLAIYLSLGMVLAGGWILFQRQLRNVVRDPELIEARLGLPIYASLTHSAFQESLAESSGRQSGAILAIANPSDPAIEGMRSLRTSLQFAFVNADNNILLITGPTARIGKTFVSSNLAAVLAASGRSVVVVDADMRCGTLHEQFGLSREPGLADAIGGELMLEDVTHETSIKGLHVVTAGAVPPNPSELLMHDRFITQIQDLSQKYDHVIIDSPPILAVTDPALLSRLAGVVLLVAKCGAHPMREIEQSYKQLVRVGANVRGVVFNDIPLFSGHVYGGQPYVDKPRASVSGA